MEVFETFAAMAYDTSTRAIAYLTEAGEDALHAVKGAIGTGSARYLDMSDEQPEKLRKQLESTHDDERLEGMKRVVAMISKGRDATPYLASVFKLSSVTSLEVRKLVYLVVLRYAPLHPDLALLSINSFQRDLADPNPLIRGMALRALSGIRLKVVAGIVLLAVGKATRDPHPYVRRVAAFALPKCHRLDPTQYETLCEYTTRFLSDRSPLVLGPAVAAYAELCPERWDVLHRPFRRLCTALADMDEWSQPLCISVLVRYARNNLPEPQNGAIDGDLKALLTALSPLTASTNEAVVLAAVRSLGFLDSTRMKEALPALVRLMRGPPEAAYLTAAYALTVDAASLAPHLTSFYVRADDPTYLALVKLRVLVHAVPTCSARQLAGELAIYTHAADVTVAEESVAALAHVARRFPKATSLCLQKLIDIAQDSDVAAPVVSRAVAETTALLPTCDPTTTARIVARFSLRLFVPLASVSRRRGASILCDASARAAVLWMLGQYCNAPLVADEVRAATLCELIAPDMLRCIVAHWEKEAPEVQCQALTLAAKVLAGLEDKRADARTSLAVRLLHTELLAKGMHSGHSDVRDRARFYSGLTRAVCELVEEEAPQNYVATYRALDALRLPGVRLRRSQVQHVLFAGEMQCSDDLASDAVPLSLSGLDAVTGVHLRGWHLAQVPPWCDVAKLPPAIVRAPDARNLSSISGSFDEEQRSISNHTVPQRDERVVLEPLATSQLPSARARYEDLDTFLESSDTSSVSDTELDASAPEDEDFE